MKRFKLVLVMCSLVSLMMGGPSWAGVAAEWQFNGNTNLTTANSGSTESTLIGSSALDNGSTGLTGWASFLQSGFIAVPDTSGSTDYNQGGLSTKDTDPDPVLQNNEYRDYFGREGVGTAGGTFYAVYKPNWYWAFGDYRRTIAMAGSEGSAIGDIWILFMDTDDTRYGADPVGPKAQLQIRNTYTWKAIDARTPVLTLDSGKWYFIAASWKDGIDPSIYIREMNPAGPGSSPAGVSGSPVLYYWDYPPLPGPGLEPLVLGARYAYGNTGNECGNGKIAWAKFLDNYTDPGQFDTVFAGLVAETYVTVQGTVNLGGYSGDKRDVQVRVELRKGAQVSTYYRQLDAAGQFAISDVAEGTYSVAVKSYAHLQQVKTAVVSVGSTSLGTFNLVGGNGDGDNAITSTDLSIVLANMDLTADN